MKRFLVAALIGVAASAWAQYIGDYKANETVYCPFMTYDSSGNLVTATALAAADVEIYKAGGITQRASDVGVTVTANFDGVNGQHMVAIDTSDNSDAGFYTALPTYYQVLIQPFTVGAETSVGVTCSFSLGVLTTALTDIKLDHLVAVADADDPVDGSIVASLASTTADWSLFVEGTDSLQAIRDRGDAAWTTGGGTGLTALASGTAQSGTSTTIVLAAAETFANDELNNNVINIHTGAGAGQARLITDYVGASDTATVSPAWITNPTATSQYEVVNGPVFIASIAAGAVSAAAIGTDAVDADALATDAVNEINATVDIALTDVGLDHMVAAAVVGTDVTDDSIIARIVSKAATADWDTYVNTTDSLEANKDDQVTIGQLSTQNLADMASIGLDHLLSVAVVGTDVTDNSALAYLASSAATADWDTYVNTTDSLEAAGAVTLAAINTEVDTALVDINLDHLASAATAVVTDGSIISELTGQWSLFNSSSSGLTGLRTKMDNGVNPTTGGITNLSIATDAIGADELAATGVTEITDDIMNEVIDGTCTFKESMVAILASHVGLLAGGGTATITIEKQDDATNAIVLTVDANGNRTVVTIADC